MRSESEAEISHFLIVSIIFQAINISLCIYIFMLNHFVRYITSRVLVKHSVICSIALCSGLNLEGATTFHSPQDYFQMNMIFNLISAFI